MNPKQLDISKLSPKEQVAAHLLTANPDASNREIGRLLVQLGLYKNEETGALLLRPGTALNEIKQALQHYAHTELVAPAYKIHSDQLKAIAKKVKDNPEEIQQGAAKDWVLQAERLAGETVNINVEETVKVGVLHAFMEDLLPDVLNKEQEEQAETIDVEPE